ncbi:hypothetical protein Hanom_Chr10g00924391 [Helianthus anomalus]
MVRIRNFEFLCRSRHIDPTVDRVRVFYQLHCSQVFIILPNVCRLRRFCCHLLSPFMNGNPSFSTSRPE